jgi:hypothetical protein
LFQTLTPAAIVHVIAALALPLLAVAGAYRANDRNRAVALAGGLVAATTLVAGLLRQRLWEPGYRRAVYTISHGAGEWLDRKTHLGFAACCFALAAALATFDGQAPVRVLRLLWGLAAGFAVAAWIVVVYVHARVPNALLS